VIAAAIGLDLLLRLQTHLVVAELVSAGPPMRRPSCSRPKAGAEGEGARAGRGCAPSGHTPEAAHPLLMIAVVGTLGLGGSSGQRCR